MKSAAASSSSPGPIKGQRRTTTEAVGNKRCHNHHHNNANTKISNSSTANNDDDDAQYIYETLGDVTSALEKLNQTSPEINANANTNVDYNHNVALLNYLSSLTSKKESEGGGGNNNKYHDQLLELFARETEGESGQEEVLVDGAPSMQRLILGHNLALNYLITNKPEEGVSILLPLFRSFSKPIDGGDHTDETFEVGDIKCKVAFLLLDCVLASCKVEFIHPILKWIESFISWAATSPSSYINRDESVVSSLKFRLHCYKSRGLFLQTKYDKKRSVSEANTRIAKKELKSAMEIYHHKLATKQGTYHRHGSGMAGIGGTGVDSICVDEGASVQGSVALSIGSMSNDPLQDVPTTASSSVQISDGTSGNSPQNRTPFEIKRLYRQNQCALYLKANLEQLKGNTKKSLKLCSEAQRCGVRQRNNAFDQKYIEDLQLSSDIQSAYHFNNLAIIHQAAGKLHLAMHYYSRSLGHVERAEKQVNSMIVEKDGVASPVPLSQILFNASLCAQRLSNFSLAHECMKRCVEHSPSSFGKDPFCWLHMGESCINSHITMKRKNCRINGTSTSNFVNEMDLAFNTHSLSRAVDCLNQCILCCSSDGDKNGDEMKKGYLESARVSLAYVWMELNNPSQVITLAEVMLNEKPLFSADGKNHCVISLRRRATMRMYAFEAYQMSGIPSDAMRCLDAFVSEQGGGSNSGGEELAAHLAAINVKGRDNEQLTHNAMTRLKRAKASVQLSTAMTKLSLGDIERAREEAQTAFESLSHEPGMSDMKRAACSSLIQALIYEGKLWKAAQIARNLK